MRILDLNNFYTPTGGGVRIYHDRKRAYYSGLAVHDYALAVPSDRREVLRRGHVSLYRARSLPMGTSGYRLIVSPTEVAEIVHDFQPDVIEIGSPYVMPLVVRRVLRESRIATVGFYHADYPDAYARKIAGWLSTRLAGPIAGLARRHASWTYRSMDAVFGASRYVLEKLYALGVRPLFHTPLGVDSDLFHPARYSDDVRRELNVDRHQKLVLFLARLTTEKGIDLLMRSYPEFREPERIRLVIGGHGPYEKHVASFLKKYPEVGRLPFESDRKRVAGLMASADVYLSMSNDETFGLAIVEALACGTPVVAPDAGAAAELISGSDLLEPYRAGDEDAFLAHLQTALRLDRHEVSERLRSYAKRFDWTSCFDRITANYQRVIRAVSDDAAGSLEPENGRHWPA